MYVNTFSLVSPSFDLPDIDVNIDNGNDGQTVAFHFSTPASLSMIGNWTASVITKNDVVLTGEATFLDAISKGNTMYSIKTKNFLA